MKSMRQCEIHHQVKQAVRTKELLFLCSLLFQQVCSAPRLVLSTPEHGQVVPRDETLRVVAFADDQVPQTTLLGVRLGQKQDVVFPTSGGTGSGDLNISAVAVSLYKFPHDHRCEGCGARISFELPALIMREASATAPPNFGEWVQLELVASPLSSFASAMRCPVLT
eukprot:2537272-Rhodomonas_salina.2